MRWLIDECVDARITVHLRHLGPAVASVVETMQYANDRASIEHAQANARLLLTEDKDFGELVVRRGMVVPGLISLRLQSDEIDRNLEMLAKAIEASGPDLFGRHTIIGANRIRARMLRET